MELFDIFRIVCVVIVILCATIPMFQLIAKSRREDAQAEAKRVNAQRKAEQDAANKATRERIAENKRRERERQQAAKVEAARKIAEYNQAALQAAKELRQLRREDVPQLKAPARQDAQPAEVKRPEIISAPHGNEAFKGHTVAFTGTLPGMTRREAIAAVQANGGRAFETMPAGTTLLVVGDKPGMNKLDKADKWIDQVRKITPRQFKAMLDQPLTLTPDDFAAMYAPRTF